MFRRFFALMLVPLIGGGGCALELEGARCDCADGYVCCELDQICYRPGHACGSGNTGGAGAAGAALATGGSTNAGDTAFAMSGGAAGASHDSDRAGDATGGAGAGESGSPPSRGGSTSDDSAGTAGTGDSSAGSESGEFGGSAAGGEGGAASVTAGASGGVFAVLTQHNDNARSGVNPLERELTQVNVQSGAFRELSRRPLRGAVFAQPLLVPKVPLATGERNVVFVSTMANVVYAFDADAPNSPPLWVRVLDEPIELPDDRVPLGADGIWHEVGILGTPVIQSGALYVVTASKAADAYRHRLYALDIVTGAIQKSVPIAAPGFDSAGHAERAGLTYAGGTLYVAFGGYTLDSEAGGWLFAYDTQLELVGSLALGNPNGAGITQSGQAPAADPDGALYFTTSPVRETNGLDASNWSKSLLRIFDIRAQGVTSLFTPPAVWAPGDEIGNAGALLVPGTDFALLSDPSRIYLLQRNAGAQSALIQTLIVNENDGCRLGDGCDAAPFAPVLWAGAGVRGIQRLYTWLPNDQLHGFQFNPQDGKFVCEAGDAACPPFATSTLDDSRDALAHPPKRGAALSFSTNLDAPGTGLLWAVHGYVSDKVSSDDGIVRAFNADTLAALWDSNRAGTPLGPLAPGATPTVSGGHVYVATADGLMARQSFAGNGNGGSPALANFGDELLIIAWGLSPDVTRGIELAWSTDGAHFDGTSIVPARFLSYDPALAADDDAHLYLGWPSAAETAEVLVADDPQFSSSRSMLQRTASGALEPLALKATSSLALAFGDHRLFMAWYDDLGLHFISSSDGVAFELDSLRDFPDFFGYSAPLLSYQDGQLFLAATTTDGLVHLMVSSDAGAHFSSPTTLPMSSNGHPALLWQKLTNDTGVSYSWLWSEHSSGYGGPLRMSTGRIGDFSLFTGTRPLEAITADPSVSATNFKGAWYVAWSDSSGVPNVARYSSGELVTYGLASP
jgi:hypothetical protein